MVGAGRELPVSVIGLTEVDEAGAAASGVVEIRRSTARVLAKMVRDPLTVIPDASFERRLVLTRNFGRLRAYLSDPALVHEALVRNADHLAKSAEAKRVLGAALGDGLLISDGHTWRWQRQTLAPAFQPHQLAGMQAAMIGAAETTATYWAENGSAGGVVDIGHAMMRTTFAIILDTMLSGPQGMDAGRVERGVGDFLGATSWMFALALLKAPPWTPFPGRTRALAATRFMRATVRDRVRQRRAKGGDAGDLIGMLLAAADPDTGRHMNDDEITDNILTFIAAGHETTAIALSWTLALLARHAEVNARLEAELDSVVGDDPVSPEHISRLPYARQVVSEALRLYPPAPLIARTVESALEIGGTTLPPGSLLFVPIYAMHRHRKLWVDPDRFDPDRFAPEQVKARHRFAFMPFGAGPRICIGNNFAILEAVAILAVLRRAFRFAAVEPELPQPRMTITLRPRRPINLRVIPRTAA